MQQNLFNRPITISWHVMPGFRQRLKCKEFVELTDMSHDLWKPALMTFKTFYVKIIWKTTKIKKFDMFKYCLKTYSDG